MQSTAVTEQMDKRRKSWSLSAGTFAFSLFQPGTPLSDQPESKCAADFGNFYNVPLSPNTGMMADTHCSKDSCTAIATQSLISELGNAVILRQVINCIGYPGEVPCINPAACGFKIEVSGNMTMDAAFVVRTLAEFLRTQGACCSRTVENREDVMSQTEELRDRLNKKLGEIRTDSNGQQTLFNATNRRVGEYNPKTNETRDANNRLIGKGNLLGTLLK